MARSNRGGHNLKDLQGQIFGRLTVIERAGSSKNRQAKWACLCSCGGKSIVTGSNLRYGGVRSCGCLPGMKTHDKSNTIEYRCWLKMRSRCTNPSDKSYNNYGARGIRVCDRWEIFITFYADMKDRPRNKTSIERIDNDGPYSPANCIWANQTMQNRNKRNNDIINYHGEFKSLIMWVEEKGLPYHRTHDRIHKLHWSVERAFSEPMKSRKVIKD